MENELNKIKRHIPIRELVKRAAAALQALKPVWLMSPMSVAQYVPPELQTSTSLSSTRRRKCVLNLIGAIARGAKVVVVGDFETVAADVILRDPQGLDDDDEEEFRRGNGIDPRFGPRAAGEQAKPALALPFPARGADQFLQPNVAPTANSSCSRARTPAIPCSASSTPTLREQATKTRSIERKRRRLSKLQSG